MSQCECFNSSMNTLNVFLLDRIYLGNRCCCHSCLNMPAPDTESKLYTLGNGNMHTQDTPCMWPGNSRLRLAQCCSLYPAGRTPGMLLLSYHILFLLPSLGSRNCSHGDRVAAVWLYSSPPPSCRFPALWIKGYGDKGAVRTHLS